MHSFVSLGGWHIHEFVSASAPDVAAAIELNVFGDSSKLPQVARPGLFLNNDSVIADSQKAVVVLALHDLDPIARHIQLPVLVPFVSHPPLGEHVGAARCEHHVWNS